MPSINITTREVIAKLRAGFKIDGDPESEVPCGLIDPNQTTTDSVPLLPVAMLRELLENGTAENNSGTERRLFKLA